MSRPLSLQLTIAREQIGTHTLELDYGADWDMERVALWLLMSELMPEEQAELQRAKNQIQWPRGCGG
jgi:hypothetical protein